MMVINRNSGTTSSERKLAELGDRTFLNLWSYPNTFIDRKQHGRGTGNEFCDLLVICGDDVLIFSDKSVEWPQNADVNVSWARWYRRAIDKSVRQIRGAASWLSKFPDRIYLDSNCTQKLPLTVPPPDRIRIHGIAVAVGANQACAAHYGDNVGTFLIKPAIKDTAHVNPSDETYQPFAIGDTDTSGPFVHVFDEISLDVLLHELDTISDFVRYLGKRSNLIRTEKLLFAGGEEDLVAHYLRFLGPDGEHDFTTGNKRALGRKVQLALMDGTYEVFISNPQYIARKKADQISYAWDSLINKFTTNIIAGTSIVLGPEPATPIDAEPGLRIMALESRVSRRLLGHVIQDAVQSAVQSGKDRFFRMFMPGLGSRNKRTAYVVLIMAYRPVFDSMGGYDAYRKLRSTTLEAYCLNAKYRYKSYDFIVGIAFDMPIPERVHRGMSEDIIAIGNIEWSEELVRYTEEARDKLDIFKSDMMPMFGGSVNEYPDGKVASFDKSVMSRQQRRRLERAARNKGS